MVLRKALQTTRFPDLPEWMRDADQSLVEESKRGLEQVLNRKYGDNVDAKIASLDRLVERVKNGDIPRGLCKADFVAAFQVLVDLRVNSKEG